MAQRQWAHSTSCRRSRRRFRSAPISPAILFHLHPPPYSHRHHHHRRHCHHRHHMKVTTTAARFSTRCNPTRTGVCSAAIHLVHTRTPCGIRTPRQVFRTLTVNTIRILSTRTDNNSSRLRGVKTRPMNRMLRQFRCMARSVVRKILLLHHHHRHRPRQIFHNRPRPQRRTSTAPR